MNDQIKTQCYLCGSFRVNGKWDGVNREIIRTGNVSHCPCDDCFPEEMDRLEKESEEYLEYMKAHPEKEYTDDTDIRR